VDDADYENGAFEEKGAKRRRTAYYKPTLQEKIAIVELRKRWSFKSVQVKYRSVSSDRQISRYKAQLLALEKSARVISKDLDSHLFEKFVAANDQLLVIHDINLKLWASKIAIELGCPRFKASNSFVARWKIKHKIVSRKITKFCSKKKAKNDPKLEKAVENHRSTIITKIEENGAENVYNADHTSIVKELRSKRSLAHRGTKTITKKVQSVAATTHSHTLVPFISASGRTLPIAYMVLQETTGHKFGKKVKKTMFKPKNLRLVCSKSGKMHGFQTEDMFDHCFLPFAADDISVVMLDSWTGFIKTDLLDVEVKYGKEVEICTIPPGATAVAQPLDVGWNYYLKEMQRKMTEKIILAELDFPVYIRDNIVKLTSIVFHQLCSPRFTEMVKYAWFKAGYLKERPGYFQNPSSFVLDSVFKICEKSGCNKHSFMRCAWCAQYLCFTHIFKSTDFHLCDNYVPL